MDGISTHVRNSILRACTAKADSTADRSQQMAVYLRLSNVSAHAGGSISGVIEMHVPLDISEVRIGCKDSVYTEPSTLIVPQAWIELTGTYKDERQVGVFHYAKIPLSNMVIQNDQDAATKKGQSSPKSSISSQTDSEPASPGMDCLSPRRQYGPAAGQRKSRVRSTRQQLGSDRSSIPTPIGISDVDAEGKTRYKMYSGKTLIPFKVSIDPRLANSYDYDGAAISYWTTCVFCTDKSTIHDSVSFHARQVEIYQLEDQYSFDADTSMSSTGSKVAMGGPGKLEVVAWVEPPAFGILEGSEAKIVMYVRNFTRKKTQGIKLEVFRSRDHSPENFSDIKDVKIAEEVYLGEDHRFEPGYSTHVTVGIRLPSGNYSSNGISGFAMNYVVKSSVMAPLSNPVYVVSPIRIVRHQSFPDGCFGSTANESIANNIDHQTKAISPVNEAVLVSPSNYESKLQLAQAKLENILQHDTLYKARPKHYMSRSTSVSEADTTDSWSDSDNKNSTKLAYVARVCRPTYRMHPKQKPKQSREPVKLTLDTSLRNYRSSTSSHETGTAELSDSRFSLMQNTGSLASPHTPVEYLDTHQVWVRTMSAPDLALSPDLNPDIKRLSTPIDKVASDIESSLGDAFKRNAISRRTHVKAVSWRSGFDENRNLYCRSR